MLTRGWQGHSVAMMLGDPEGLLGTKRMKLRGLGRGAQSEVWATEKVICCLALLYLQGVQRILKTWKKNCFENDCIFNRGQMLF